MKRFISLLAAMLIVLQWAGLSAAQTAPTDASPQAQSEISKALAYLKAQQKPDFTWQREGDPPGVSALVLKAFMGDPKNDPDTPFLENAFNKLLSYQKPEGGIYVDALANYNTAIAISALSASKEAEYKPQIAKALAFLKRLQWNDTIDKAAPERDAVDQKDPRYGGWGYGKTGRPDASNLQMAVDALHDAGVAKDDPAYKAALVFASRLQNNSETNDQSWASNDGGFIYTDANGGMSVAGDYTDASGRKLLRSYGSMTYAGLKSMIYAGLTHDDPRVKAAWSWIIHNWTLDENPGLRAGNPQNAKGGLYYYYHTLARALRAYGQPVIETPDGQKHDWRVELVAKLGELQAQDGSWAGEKRWMEDNPILVTAYSVLALQEAQQDLKDHPAP